MRFGMTTPAAMPEDTQSAPAFTPAATPTSQDTPASYASRTDTFINHPICQNFKSQIDKKASIRIDYNFWRSTPIFNLKLPEDKGDQDESKELSYDFLTPTQPKPFRFKRSYDVPKMRIKEKTAKI